MTKPINLFILIAGLSANFINAQANSNNSFDFVGQNHNVFLAQYAAANPALDIQTINSDVNRILRNDASFQNLIRTYGFNQVDYKLIDFTASDINDQFSTKINSTTLSSNAKLKLTELMGNVFKMANSTAEPSKDDLKNMVVTFETELQRSNLSRDEINKILYSTSVLRYSAFYWKDNYRSSASSVTGKRKWWGWLVMAASDVIGGVIGSAGGPATTVGTAIAASQYADTVLTGIENQPTTTP